MEDTLQNIIDQVYQEGIEKSQQEGEEILRKAKDAADAILKNANKEKERIRAKALADTEHLKLNVISELQLAKQEAISNFRLQVSDMLAQFTVKKPLSSAFNDIAFFQRLLITAIEKWNINEESISLDILLPENEQHLLDEFVAKKTEEALSQGIEIKMNQYTTKGFKMVSEKQGYSFNFMIEDFEQFFIQHLRQKTLSLLKSTNEHKE